MIEEHENISLKRERERGRQRSLTLNKKKRGKRRRSGSEDGKINIGNSRTIKFCSWCRPTLANRILHKKVLDTYFKSDIIHRNIPTKDDEEEEDRIDQLEEEAKEANMPFISQTLANKYHNPVDRNLERALDQAILAYSMTSLKTPAISFSSQSHSYTSEENDEIDQESVISLLSDSDASSYCFLWHDEDHIDNSLLETESVGVGGKDRDRDMMFIGKEGEKEGPHDTASVSSSSSSSDLTYGSFSSWDDDMS